MRYTNLPSKIYSQNRKEFSQHLEPNSIAVFFSNDLMPKTADQFFSFHQNTDMFYLSGIDQEESILILYPDAPSEKMKEILLLRETNEYIAVWEGEKLTKEKARSFSGIKNVQWNDQFSALIKGLLSHADTVYFNFNEHDRYDSDVPYLNYRMAKKIKDEYPLHTYKRANPIMKKLRAIKNDGEIEMMQMACNITGDAFLRVLKFVKPGVKEYEIEGEIIHEFIRKAARGHAYEPIVASGANACVLHYVQNHDVCKDGDLILFDFGCEYGMYASDLSRTIPVNGKYTPRQKEVYNAVLDVQKQCYQMLRPGVILAEYQAEVEKLLENKCIELGLFTKSDVANQNPEQPLVKKYFPHGTSHHIGLDVHDIPFREDKIEAGMAFTIEPGLYIREEGIGVRIENDIIITNEGYLDLMQDIPREVEEIEDIMNRS